MDALTLAVPTGRLFDGAIALVQRLGLSAARLSAAAVPATAPSAGVPDRAERSLVVEAGALRLLITKPADILTYVEHGAADVGILGKDLLLEQERDVYELVDLGFGFCRGVIALPRSTAAQLWRPGIPLRIATKYPRATRQFFERLRRPVEIIELHGSVELAPRVALADGIMDLVMTGQTLRDNLLTEVAEVFRSTARLVANRVSLRTRSAAVRSLVEQVSAASSPVR